MTTLPANITQAEYGIYGLQAVAVIVTFVVGMLLVPSLTSNIFSGGGGESRSVAANRRRSSLPSRKEARHVRDRTPTTRDDHDKTRLAGRRTKLILIAWVSPC